MELRKARMRTSRSSPYSARRRSRGTQTYVREGDKIADAVQVDAARDAATEVRHGPKAHIYRRRIRPRCRRGEVSRHPCVAVQSSKRPMSRTASRVCSRCQAEGIFGRILRTHGRSGEHRDAQFVDKVLNLPRKSTARTAFGPAMDHDDDRKRAPCGNRSWASRRNRGSFAVFPTGWSNVGYCMSCGRNQRSRVKPAH